MSDYEHYDIDDDEEPESQYVIELRKSLKNITFDNYMRYPNTRNILIQKWEENFSENLEVYIEMLFERYYESLNDMQSNLFYRAEPHHGSDLVMLVRYHIIRECDTSIFDENPRLAETLINNIKTVKKQQLYDEQKEYRESFKKSNKHFNWLDNNKLVKNKSVQPKQTQKKTNTKETNTKETILIDKKTNVEKTNEQSNIYKPSKNYSDLFKKNDNNYNWFNRTK